MEIHQDTDIAFQEKTIKYQEPGRGSTILILGILSIVLLGPFTGIPAWVMGHKDLKKISNGLISYNAKSSTQIGMVLGIISSALTMLALIGVIMALSISIFLGPSSVDKNREAVIYDCMTAAFDAQYYYRKPVSLGGGGNSFIGYDNFMSKEKSETSNGLISVENIADGSLSIVGIGNEYGKDETNMVRVEIKVYPDRIEPANILN